MKLKQLHLNSESYGIGLLKAIICCTSQSNSYLENVYIIEYKEYLLDDRYTNHFWLHVLRNSQDVLIQRQDHMKK